MFKLNENGFVSCMDDFIIYDENDNNYDFSLFFLEISILFHETGYLFVKLIYNLSCWDHFVD